MVKVKRKKLIQYAKEEAFDWAYEYGAKSALKRYEDLNDLCTILIPVENEKDPLWEKGARAITLAVLIAMLEDSANPELNLTKEKYNTTIIK